MSDAGVLRRLRNAIYRTVEADSEVADEDLLACLEELETRLLGAVIDEPWPTRFVYDTLWDGSVPSRADMIREVAERDRYRVVSASCPTCGGDVTGIPGGPSPTTLGCPSCGERVPADPRLMGERK